MFGRILRRLCTLVLCLSLTGRDAFDLLLLLASTSCVGVGRHSEENSILMGVVETEQECCSVRSKLRLEDADDEND